jgi:hypothetical protein
MPPGSRGWGRAPDVEGFTDHHDTAPPPLVPSGVNSIAIRCTCSRTSCCFPDYMGSSAFLILPANSADPYGSREEARLSADWKVGAHGSQAGLGEFASSIVSAEVWCLFEKASGSFQAQSPLCISPTGGLVTDQSPGTDSILLVIPSHLDSAEMRKSHYVAYNLQD